MSAIRITGLALVLVSCGGLWAGVAAADDAAPMYDPSKVYVIDLTVPKATEDELAVHPKDKYLPASLTLRETAGTPGTEGPPVVNGLEIGIKLKGNGVGSFRDLKDGKAAFKIKCNFVSGKKCLGLKKMTLNNMVQDRSMIHETLAYDVFRASGVPASRTGYAFVRVNGEDFAVYLNIETLDDVGLERWFGEFDDPQHLYEGEYSTDVKPGEAGKFEVDEGDEADRSDLEALIAAVADEGAPFSERVVARADLSEMTRMWAVEKYVGQWDGYAGAGPTLLPFNQLPNNYYLFSDATGKFQMLPWGTDQTWETAFRVPFDGEAGLLFDECLAEPACHALYLRELRAVSKVVPWLGLDSLAAATADLLEPWQEQEQANGRHEHDLAEIQDGVAEARSFIADRPAELAAFLGPEEEGAAPPATSSTKSAPASPSIHVGRFGRAGRALVTHLWFAAAGLVSQTAKLKTENGSQRACSVHVTVPSGGPLILRCELSDEVRRRLRLHGLTLRVSTHFVPQAGSPESTFRRVHLARTPVR